MQLELQEELQANYGTGISMVNRPARVLPVQDVGLNV